MTFKDKCNFAIEELEKSKILKFSYNPLIFTLAHKLGLNIPYPHYNSFMSNFLISGVRLAIIWGASMYYFLWRTQNITAIHMALQILVVGTLCGVLSAFHYKYSAKNNNLTPWAEINNS